MGTDPAAIRENAAKLAELHARIYETLPQRSEPLRGKGAWEAACAEFHSRFNELFFPGGLAAWESFLSNKPEGIEAAIAFLEVDPVTFRSGYNKQILWQRLKQVWLSPEEKERIERVALSYLEVRLRREFWHMVRYVRLRGSSEFWQQIEKLASHRVRSEPAIRAGWLMLARQNKPVRNQLGYEMLRPRWEPGAIPMRDLWQRQNEA